MSIVDVDFGASPVLKKGDLVRVENAYFPDGEAINPDPHGIVVRVSQVFRHGALAGQARCVDIGVPWDAADPEESMGWFILEDIAIDNISRMVGESLKESKHGKVLPFQCKVDADRV
jgi:hypothetical protein